MKKNKKTSCGCVKEKNETPEYEAKYHSPSFLNKAAKVAERKRGRKRKAKRA